MIKTVLIIEDEAAIRDMVRFAFPETEVKLLEAADTPEAELVLADQIPDIILLDWMLPSKSGIDFLKQLKKNDHCHNIPVIMLTAKAEEEYKIRGLSTGADDYVTKPFSPTELLARIGAVLRRGCLTSPDGRIEINGLTLNTDNHLVQANGKTISLSPLEYDLLHFFMRKQNRVYSRNQLIDHVWGGDAFINDRTVDVHIRRLRDKLKPTGHHELIKTVRGGGYQMSIK